MTNDIEIHLKNRNFDINKYHGITLLSDAVYFPLWNFSGQLVGYQRYMPDGVKFKSNDELKGRYYTKIGFGHEKPKISVWGLDVVNGSKKDLYVVEGIFSACRLHNIGINAIAVLNNDPKYIKSWLMSLKYNIISICDGDKAGKKLANYSDKAILLPDGIYLDEISCGNVMEIIKVGVC
ncbi:MAG: hypothetical protein QM504_08070 [Pseudomonadota bacterium]